MTITSTVTIEESLRIGRCCRLLRCLLGVVIAASVLAADSFAAQPNEKKSTVPHAALQAREVKLPAPNREESARSAGDNCGCVFCNGIRLQDEIVVVNTRNLCTCCDADQIREGLALEEYAVTDEKGCRCWQPSDLATFLSFDSTVPTVIFVHGNQITPWDAKNEGLAVYRHMMLHGCDAPRIRFVIFSWPSSKVSGLLHDVRLKAARTGPAGCQLAWLIDQLPEETPVSLVGFSFGARIITGGLHILAGGSLGGCCCLSEHVHPNRPQMSVILMASALHSYWLAPGQYHGLAMTQVSRMCLINNCEDNAMKYYGFIEPGNCGFGGPQALGLCGPTCISPDYAAKIMNRDVSCSVGSEHLLMRYLCAPGDGALIWDYTVGSSLSEAHIGG
jgi:hypothetical protein